MLQTNICSSVKHQLNTGKVSVCYVTFSVDMYVIHLTVGSVYVLRGYQRNALFLWPTKAVYLTGIIFLVMNISKA